VPSERHVRAWPLPSAQSSDLGVLARTKGLDLDISSVCDGLSIHDVGREFVSLTEMIVWATSPQGIRPRPGSASTVSPSSLTEARMVRTVPEGATPLDMGIGVHEMVCCAISLTVRIGIGSSILVSKENPIPP